MYGEGYIFSSAKLKEAMEAKLLFYELRGYVVAVSRKIDPAISDTWKLDILDNNIVVVPA